MTTQQKGNIVENLKAYLFPSLASVLFGLLWMQYQKIETGIDDISTSIQKIEKVQVSDAKDIEYLRAKIGEHERWLDDIDAYLRNNK